MVTIQNAPCPSAPVKILRAPRTQAKERNDAESLKRREATQAWERRLEEMRREIDAKPIPKEAYLPTDGDPKELFQPAEDKGGPGVAGKGKGRKRK
jgi:hypothetical protein